MEAATWEIYAMVQADSILLEHYNIVISSND